jgi:protein SCO1/2
MPGMTMPFTVRDKRLLAGMVVGDLVVGTLVVSDESAYLSSLTRVGHAAVVHAAAPEPTAPLLQPGDTVPDAEFVDQDGRAVTLSSWRGQAIALTFIYTRCLLPEFCPLMDRQFAAVQRQVKTTPALNGRVHLVSVTFDPDFDTPPVLRDHARQLGADPAAWSFLTGDRTRIDAFAVMMGVSVVREADGPGGITHNLRTAVLDANRRVVAVFSGNEWTSDQLLASLGQAVSGRRK